MIKEKIEKYLKESMNTSTQLVKYRAYNEFDGPEIAKYPIVNKMELFVEFNEDWFFDNQKTDAKKSLKSLLNDLGGCGTIKSVNDTHAVINIDPKKVSKNKWINNISQNKVDYYNFELCFLVDTYPDLIKLSQGKVNINFDPFA